MSLLKDILRKNSEQSGFQPPKALTSRRGMKEYAGSIFSTGGSTIRSVRSIAESVASFYSMVTGGSRIPKRRRPDFSKLGVPKFYRKNPKPPVDMDGVKYLTSADLGPWTAAHGKSFASIEGEPAWASIILYSHASAEDARPVYHSRAKIQGELRIHVAKPIPITSIDVWLVAKSECILDLAQPPFLNATANLWKRDAGDPSTPPVPGVHKQPWKKKFPPGTYVFPFEFPALPRDVPEFQMDYRLNQDKHCRLFLPASHEFSETLGWVGWNKYLVGVNIKREGALQINDEFNFPFEYYPRCRPMPRPDTPFPFISTRDDWPFSREEVGGWTLTPFGGRGRFRDEMVEVEGLLGVQAPAVYCPGQTVKFGLLLWCTNPAALEALSQPDSFEVDYVRSDMFGLDVLDPHNSSRKNRHTTRIGNPGRVWRTDDGAPDPDAPPVVRQPQSAVAEKDTREHHAKQGKWVSLSSMTRSGLAPTRMMELYNEATVLPSGAETRAKEAAKEEKKAASLASSVFSDARTVRDAWMNLETGSVRSVAFSVKTVSSDGKGSLEEALKKLSVDDLHSTVSATSPNDEVDHSDPVASTSASPIATTSSAPDLGMNAAGSVTTLIGQSTPKGKLENTEMEDGSRAPSPTPSFEDEDEMPLPEDEGPSHTIRLDGELVVPPCVPPSYRWKYQGVEYSLHIVIKHPDYIHLSPRMSTGVVAECPLWVVTDPPRNHDTPEPSTKPADIGRLPKRGEAIPLGPGTVRFENAVGDGTDEIRPTWLGVRTWAFM